MCCTITSIEMHQVDDIVEFQTNESMGWFRGVVVGVDSDRLVYDVELESDSTVSAFQNNISEVIYSFKIRIKASQYLFQTHAIRRIVYFQQLRCVARPRAC